MGVSYLRCSGSSVGFRFKGVRRITKIMIERKIRPEHGPIRVA